MYFVRASVCARVPTACGVVNVVCLPAPPAQAFPADVVYTGIESALTAAAGNADALARIGEAITAWTAAGVIAVDSYTPLVRDAIARCAACLSGRGCCCLCVFVCE